MQTSEIDVKKLKEQVKKANEAFNALSVKEQRIWIIRDALKQIKNGKFIPTQGTYLEHVFDDENTDFTDKSLQVELVAAEECECCAKGALFASCVLNNNKVKTSINYTESPFIAKKLKKWFSSEELDMMEIAFEVDDEVGGSTFYIKHPALADACLNFGDRFDSSEERLVEILKNTLKYGQFDPYCGKKP